MKTELEVGVDTLVDGKILVDAPPLARAVCGGTTGKMVQMRSAQNLPQHRANRRP